MEYSPKLLKKHLGMKYDPEATYIIETHRGAKTRTATDSTLRVVGTVPDSSENEEGTMVVLERLSQPKKSIFNRSK